MTPTVRVAAVAILASTFFALTIPSSPALADPGQYRSPEEEARLAELQQRIENEGLHWTAGHTSVSRLSPEEKAALCGLKMGPEDFARAAEMSPDPEARGRLYPVAWDWRELGGVTPVKSHIGCGACWAFAGVAATESYVLINEGVELDLSEQQVLDCNMVGDDCVGGYTQTTWAVHENPGAVLESCIPYEAQVNDCEEFGCGDKVAFVYGHHELYGGVSDIKMNIQDHGPVTAPMIVHEDFYSYTGGCYGGSNIGQYTHAVLIVGWDDTMCGGEGAWIIKNSWGTDWGDEGFCYIKYGNSGIVPAVICRRPEDVHVPESFRVPGDFATIQAAWDGTSNGDTIRIATGTYDESVDTGLAPGRIILGGYDPTFSTRDPETYPTVIRGNEALNCYEHGRLVLDGIEMTGTWSYGSAASVIGKELVINECTVSGMPSPADGLSSITRPGGTAVVSDCVFEGNADYGLNLMAEEDAEIVIEGNLFVGNGWGLKLQHEALGTDPDGPAVIENNTFLGGSALRLYVAGDAGGNVSVTENILDDCFYGIYVDTSDIYDGSIADPTYNNVWNCVYDYVECSPGVGSISVDPIYCDEPTIGYFLHGSSPCAVAGASGTYIGAYPVGCPTGPENFVVVQEEACGELSWDAPAWRNEVDYYVIYRDTSPDCAETLATVSPGIMSYTDISIPPCEVFYYQVSCVDTSGIEGARPEAQPADICYNATLDLSVTFDAAGNLLTWSDAGGPVDYYIVERGPSAAALDSVAAVSAPATGYSDAGAPCPRENYTYRVTPVYDTGWRGVVSNEVSLDPSPSGPSGLAAEWSGSDAVLTWSPNCESDINTYRVYRDTVPMSPPPASELLVGFTSDTTFVDPALNTDWVYFYRITSVDDNNHASGYSAIAYVGQGQTLAVPSTYATIQTAIDAASAPDTVVVASGTYAENIILKEGVFVLGDDVARAAPVITSSTSPVVQVTAISDMPVFSGFTIDGQGSATGLEGWTTLLRIEDCTFQNCSYGASFKYGGSPTLSSNRFTGNSYGISVADSARPFITGNTFDLNSFAGISNTGDPGPEVGRSLADANDFVDNAYFQVFNLSAVPVDAELNYWGNDCVGDTMFYGVVSYVPWTDETHTQTLTECGTGIWDVEDVGRVALGHNFPNPFNPATTIAYAVPEPGGHVNLSVYDLAGRKVRTLVDSPVGPGEYTVTWRGVDEVGRELGSGVYFYRLQTGDTRVERKMVLLK